MCEAPLVSSSSSSLSSSPATSPTREKGSKTSKDSTVPTTQYSWVAPSDKSLRWSDHFSSLLIGGSVANTLLEFFLLALPFIATRAPIGVSLNVKGSMPLEELALFFLVCSIVRRFYNAYLEAVYFSFPKLRTQPPKEHRLKQKKDLMGRDVEQLELLDSHDKWTMVSQFLLNFGMYFILPGFYPSATAETTPQSFQERFLRLLANHYVMSFGMYWAHRSLHVVPYLWDKIHSIHHWAKHPLSRNTYEDHWADNFFNAIVGHLYAQILVPLDYQTFWFSRIFRILESLEKHSGVSCGFNIAYSLQQWLPFAQMPHHHDWHHEGFKGSNYTFSSIGGFWDCIFGTRKGGRYTANNSKGATMEDLKYNGGKNGTMGLNVPQWFSPLFPLVGLTVAVGMKLNGSL